VERSWLAGWLIQQTAIALRRVWDVPYQGVVDYNRPFVEDDSRWKAAKAALGEVKAIADSLSVPMLLVLIPEMGNFNDLYPFRAAHDSVRAVCDRSAIPFCDLLDRFRGIEAKTLWVRWDDPHFGKRAHRLAAAHIEEALERHAMLPLGAK
jgi:hypothetical protein